VPLPQRTIAAEIADHYTLIISWSISVNVKKAAPVKRGRGRPPTGTDPHIGSRLPKPLMQDLLQWAADNGISKGEAVRLLIEHGLKHPPKVKKPKE
jgi:hypothetical protein